MYLLDDIITYVPQDNHKIEQSIKEHTYKQEGVVRAILETVNGNMFYNVEVTVPGASNGTYFLTAIPESDLEYVGEAKKLSYHF